MMREVSLETLPNVNIHDPSYDKNLPIKFNGLLDFAQRHFFFGSVVPTMAEPT